MNQQKRSSHKRGRSYRDHDYHYHHHNDRNNSDERRQRHGRRNGHDDITGASSVQTLETNESGPQRSVEGWILFVSRVHEEAQEEDIRESFAEFGTIKTIKTHSHSLTGFNKGYALIEYTKKSEAQDAINTLHGAKLLGKTINVDWAFVGGGSTDDNILPNKMRR